MRRFVLTLLAGTAVLSAAGVVLALQCGSLVNKIEKQLEDAANRHFAPVTADAVARGGRPQTYLVPGRLVAVEELGYRYGHRHVAGRGEQHVHDGHRNHLFVAADCDLLCAAPLHGSGPDERCRQGLRAGRCRFGDTPSIPGSFLDLSR